MYGFLLNKHVLLISSYMHFCYVSLTNNNQASKYFDALLHSFFDELLYKKHSTRMFARLFTIAVANREDENGH